MDTNEEGIQTFGDQDGRTVLDGKTLRFNIGGVEQLQMDVDGALSAITTTGAFQMDGDNIYLNNTDNSQGSIYANPIDSDGYISLDGNGHSVYRCALNSIPIL